MKNKVKFIVKKGREGEIKKNMVYCIEPRRLDIYRYYRQDSRIGFQVNIFMDISIYKVKKFARKIGVPYEVRETVVVGGGKVLGWDNDASGWVHWWKGTTRIPSSAFDHMCRSMGDRDMK